MSIEGEERSPTVAAQSLLLRRREPEEAAGVRVRVRAEAFGGAAVDGRIEIVDAAWLRIVRMTAASHGLVHCPTAGAGGVVAVWLQVQGTSVVDQAKRSARLIPGRWCVVSSLRPYSLHGTGPTQRLGLLVPAEHFQSVDVDALAARAYPSTTGMARLAFDAARSGFEKTFDTTSAADLAESIVRLVVLALQEEGLRKSADENRLTLVERIHMYIADNLSNPELSLDSMSRSLNVSKRSLHRAVRDIGESIHDLIWHARLKGCLSDLQDPAKDHVRIGKIAHDWGFKNLTHFSRAFREHFGISARDSRRFGRSEEPLED